MSILVLDETADSFYPLNKNVSLLQLPLSFGITKDGNIFSRKIKWLGDVLKLRIQLKRIKPDLVITTEYPYSAAAILTGARKTARVIAWEHHHYHELKRNRFWNMLFSYCYPKLNAIICLNGDEKKIYEKINASAVVIPNFIQEIPEASSLNNKKILTIARLAPVKGMDQLTTLAKMVFKNHPDWTWKVIGRGELEKEIIGEVSEEASLANLEIKQPIDHQVANEYTDASIYVMLSRNECFPMTLLEAQSAGLPCIAFNCETGPRHIIKDDKNGILIETGEIDEMAENIISMIDHEEKRKMFGSNALANSKNFTPEKIYVLWEKLLNHD